MRRLLTACALTLVVGCGGSDGAGTPKNLDEDGLYGFDGDGWTNTDPGADEDFWENGTKTMLVDIYTDPPTTDPLTVAQDDKATFQAAVPDTVFLFDAKVIPGTKGAWYGWNYVQKGERDYEAFFIDGNTEVDVELGGPSLSEADALAILKSFRIIPPKK